MDKLKVECLSCGAEFPYFHHDTLSDCPSCSKRGQLCMVRQPMPDETVKELLELYRNDHIARTIICMHISQANTNTRERFDIAKFISDNREKIMLDILKCYRETIQSQHDAIVKEMLCSVKPILITSECMLIPDKPKITP